MSLLSVMSLLVCMPADWECGHAGHYLIFHFLRPTSTDWGGEGEKGVPAGFTLSDRV